MSGDNVVELATFLHDAPPVEVRRRGWDECGHKHVILDEKLRTAACRDCGEERLDPMEVLIMLARHWQSWKYEADKLRELREEHKRHETEKWERARDRHLNANPEHRATFDPTRRGWTHDMCRQCSRLETTAPRIYAIRPAEPPPGPLLPGASS